MVSNRHDWKKEREFGPLSDRKLRQIGHRTIFHAGAVAALSGKLKFSSE
jgi:hypothetical protein